LEYEYERADMTDAVRVILRTRGRMGWIYRPAVLVAVGVLAVLDLVLNLSKGESASFAVWLVLMVAVLSLVPRLTGRRLVKANEHQGRLRVTVDEEGLRLAGAHAESRLAWASYGSYAETDRIFALRGPYRASGTTTVLVKRGAHAPEDVDRLREILDRHLTRV
jgi:hypothetical protein